VARGSLLRVDVEQAGRVDALYLLNTPSDRRAVERIRAGEIDLGRALPAETLAAAPEQRNVYRIYEENIGPLTPLVSQEIKEAEEVYPYEWFEDAFREAAQLNKRSWRYVARILERWAADGRNGEKAGRASAAGEAIRARVLGRFDR
jgi:DnaD/phage-associated family protein